MLRKLTNTLFLICCFTLFFITPLIAQGSIIQDLKEGVLVVRLKSGDKKATELQRLIDSPNVSAKRKIQLEEQLHQTIFDQKTFNTQQVYAFRNMYKFSKVLFMFDTASSELKAGKQSGYFLNDQLEVDESISLDDQVFYVASIAPLESGADGLVIMDKTYTPLKRPFPYFVKLRSVGQVIASIFTPKTANEVDFLRVCKKLDKKLHKYYKKQL